MWRWKRCVFTWNARNAELKMEKRFYVKMNVIFSSQPITVRNSIPGSCSGVFTFTFFFHATWREVKTIQELNRQLLQVNANVRHWCQRECGEPQIYKQIGKRSASVGVFWGIQRRIGIHLELSERIAIHSYISMEKSFAQFEMNYGLENHWRSRSFAKTANSERDGAIVIGFPGWINTWLLKCD